MNTLPGSGLHKSVVDLIACRAGTSSYVALDSMQQLWPEESRGRGDIEVSRRLLRIALGSKIWQEQCSAVFACQSLLVPAKFALDLLMAHDHIMCCRNAQLCLEETQDQREPNQIPTLDANPYTRVRTGEVKKNNPRKVPTLRRNSRKRKRRSICSIITSTSIICMSTFIIPVSSSLA